MSDRELFIKLQVKIDNLWVARDGKRWCFLYIDGFPFLTCEDDA